MPDTILDVRTEPPARRHALSLGAVAALPADDVLEPVAPTARRAHAGPLGLGRSFTSFVVGTLVMVAVITGVALAGSAWLLVPAFVLFMGVTAWVFTVVNQLLDDDGEPSD